MNETIYKDSNNKSNVDLEIESLQATEASLKQSINTRQANAPTRALAREKLALKQVQDRLKEITPKSEPEAKSAHAK